MRLAIDRVEFVLLCQPSLYPIMPCLSPSVPCVAAPIAYAMPVANVFTLAMISCGFYYHWALLQDFIGIMSCRHRETIGRQRVGKMPRAGVGIVPCGRFAFNHTPATEIDANSKVTVANLSLFLFGEPSTAPA
jgi:hypothetical protein